MELFWRGKESTIHAALQIMNLQMEKAGGESGGLFAYSVQSLGVIDSDITIELLL